MRALQAMRVYHGRTYWATAGSRALGALAAGCLLWAGPALALPVPGLATPAPAASAARVVTPATPATPPAMSAISARAASRLPPFAASASAPVTPPASPLPLTQPQVESRLHQAVRDLFARPEQMLTVIPLSMPAEEERKTLWALGVLFRPARIEELTIKGVTAEGRVASLTLRVRDVNVFGLRVDEMTVVAEDFAIDLPRLAAKGEVGITGDARTRMGARVLEDDLNRVSPAYRMELKHDDFAVSGRAGVLFIRAGYRLHGALVANPENQLIFRPRSLSYGILPIPRALYAAQVRRLNPLFDMARFLGMARGGFDLRFERVALEDRQCTVSLTGTIHARPLAVAPLPPPPPRN